MAEMNQTEPIEITQPWECARCLTPLKDERVYLVGDQLFCCHCRSTAWFGYCESHGLELYPT